MNIQPNINSVNPNPRFTGIFIPAEILELEELTHLEVMLVSWIDALFCREHGGCFASNSHLAQRLRVKENTIVTALVHLRKIGLIEDVSFNGRVRVIRTKINEYIEKRQSQSAYDLNHTLPMIKIIPRVLEKSQALIYRDKRLDKSIENTPLTPKVLKPDKTTSSSSGGDSLKPLKKFGDFVELSEDDYAKLKALAPNLDQIIEEMNDWIGAKGKNPYKSFFHALKQWIRKRDTEVIKTAKSKSFTLCSDEKKTREIAQKLRENAI